MLGLRHAKVHPCVPFTEERCMLPMVFSNIPQRALIATTALVLMVACAAEPHQAVQPVSFNANPATPVPVTPATRATQPERPLTQGAIEEASATEESFTQWCHRFRAEALAAGIDASVFDQAFKGLQPDPEVVASDRSQPEFSRPVWEYLEGALSLPRISIGQRLLNQYEALLKQLEAKYGVNRHILVAIWGMESSFGRNIGDKSVIRSLATLAHEGRRPDFAKTQLLAALKILQNGDISLERMQGSWAGAMGQTQFIPTTYQDYAVDFDGDGRRDIWDSVADALASTAHYVQASGWDNRHTWGFEVHLPKNFDYALADPDIRKPLTDWRRLGVIIPSLPGQDVALGTLVLPAGYRGPAFLVLDNFRAILQYNNSTSYALAINLLAERFNGGGRILARWPKEQRILSRSERLELQTRLNELGFNSGVPDSIIGANTRRAIRAYQQQLGWPADGYPTPELLAQLRR